MDELRKLHAAADEAVKKLTTMLAGFDQARASFEDLLTTARALRDATAES